MKVLRRFGAIMRMAFASSVVLLFMAKPSGARPLHRVSSEHYVVGRLNPLGLGYFGEVSYERRLFSAEHPALENNFLSVGILPAVSPALARLGGIVEVQPLSVLNISASYEYVNLFGNFDMFQSFSGVTDEYSEQALRSRATEPSTRNYPTWGTQWTLSALLQAKLGPIAARSKVRLIYSDFQLRRGDRTFYDAVHDILSPDEGWMYAHDLDVVWISDFGLTAGTRWSTADAIYQDRHFGANETGNPNPNGPIHRIGPLLAYTFWEDGNSAFDKPTALLVLNWYLSHRYRTGEEISTAVPYVVLGFTWTGELSSLFK